VRGMEFGTTPLPLGREETFRRGQLFDTPSWCVIPGGLERTARYSIFLFAVPPQIHSIQSVAIEANAVILLDEHSQPAISVPAHGCEKFLSEGDFKFPTA
jgi:hypothetical protein